MDFEIGIVSFGTDGKLKKNQSNVFGQSVCNMTYSYKRNRYIDSVGLVYERYLVNYLLI
jgi:hypothetical protein